MIEKFFILFLSAGTAAASPKDYSKIDAYAKSTPESKATNVETLVRYLITPAKGDSEKVRSIFFWETSHISYDWDAYENGTYQWQEPIGTLKRRKGVCQNFSDLFTAMCDAAGLEAQTISGYAKSNIDNSWMYNGFGSSNHAWNVVKINGHWQLMDVTWAQNMSTTSYFMANPKEFRKDHLPADARWQLTRDTLTLKQYENQPVLDDGYDVLHISHLAPMLSCIKGKKKVVFEFDSNQSIDLKARVRNYAHTSSSEGTQLITHKGNHYTLELTFSKEGIYWVTLSSTSYFYDIASYVVDTYGAFK